MLLVSLTHPKIPDPLKSNMFRRHILHRQHSNICTALEHEILHFWDVFHSMLTGCVFFTRLREGCRDQLPRGTILRAVKFDGFKQMGSSTFKFQYFLLVCSNIFCLAARMHWIPVGPLVHNVRFIHMWLLQKYDWYSRSVTVSFNPVEHRDAVRQFYWISLWVLWCSFFTLFSASLIYH